VADRAVLRKGLCRDSLLDHLRPCAGVRKESGARCDQR
jgi:hypothetical protein